MNAFLFAFGSGIMPKLLTLSEPWVKKCRGVIMYWKVHNFCQHERCFHWGGDCANIGSPKFCTLRWRLISTPKGLSDEQLLHRAVPGQSSSFGLAYGSGFLQLLMGTTKELFVPAFSALVYNWLLRHLLKCCSFVCPHWHEYVFEEDFITIQVR